MYLPYVLNFILFYKELLRKSKRGAAIPHLNKEIFYSLIIGIPPYQEQVRIVNKINEICSELKHSKDENQWKEFSTFIPELDSEFSKALTARYPELTINERRLCILLNMNLSTKEISEITRQSTQSINTARTRLRNKLGLTGKDISFQEFFSKIK